MLNIELKIICLYEVENGLSLRNIKNFIAEDRLCFALVDWKWHCSPFLADQFLYRQFELDAHIRIVPCKFINGWMGLILQAAVSDKSFVQTATLERIDGMFIKLFEYIKKRTSRDAKALKWMRKFFCTKSDLYMDGKTRYLCWRIDRVTLIKNK